MDTINCLSLNVRGLRDSSKRLKIFNYLKAKSIDFAFLQETYCCVNFEKQFKAFWDGDIFHSFTDSNHSRGVCIMISKKVEHRIVDKYCDDYGRIVILNVEMNNEYFSFVSVYCPNNVSERVVFLDKYLMCYKKSV